MEEEKPTVYLETTIPSYLAGRPSNNLILAGEQEVTRQWWEQRKDHFQLFISELVLEEVQRGDPLAAQRRIETIAGIEFLEIDDEVIRLTAKLLQSGLFTLKAAADAGHIAIASRHSVDYLLTWNCKHIANAELVRRLSFIVNEAGYYLPVICTPIELFGGDPDE